MPILKSTYVTRVVWTSVTLLAVSGAVGSVSRAFSTARGRMDAASLSRTDEWSMRNTARAVGLRPGMARYDAEIAEGRRFFGKFYEYPTATWMHVAPAAVFMLLAPLQFWRRLRSRHITVHRWSGRLIVALAVPIGISGLFFGLFVPYDGILEAAAVGIFGAFFLFALARAFLAIRRKDVATHREWMIRMFGVALGVVMQRVLSIPAFVITREGPHAWFAETIWLGFGVTVIAAELWIRGTRRHTAVDTGVTIPRDATISSLSRDVART